MRVVLIAVATSYLAAAVRHVVQPEQAELWLTYTPLANLYAARSQSRPAHIIIGNRPSPPPPFDDGHRTAGSPRRPRAGAASHRRIAPRTARRRRTEHFRAAAAMRGCAGHIDT